LVWYYFSKAIFFSFSKITHSLQLPETKAIKNQTGCFFFSIKVFFEKMITHHWCHFSVIWEKDFKHLISESFFLLEEHPCSIKSDQTLTGNNLLLENFKLFFLLFIFCGR